MFRKAYEEAVKVVTDCSKDKILTEQHHKEAVDVNNIVERYNASGILPRMREGQYLDVTEIGDFGTMRAALARVESNFALLPARVRAEFKNDAANYVEFLKTATKEDCVKKGLIPEVMEVVQKSEEKPAQPAGEGA